MSANYFAGSIEGNRFVAVQTLLRSEQFTAGVVVDMLTPLPGSRVPKFTEAGWLFRKVAPDISPELVTTLVESTDAEILDVGEVGRDQVGEFVGPKVVEQVLRPYHLEPETPPQ